MSNGGKSPVREMLAGFEWGRLARPELTSGQVADKARRALRRFRDWRVDLPSGNRLERAAQRLEAAHERLLGEESEDGELIGDAARTALDFYLVSNCDDEPPDDLLIGKVREAAEGGDRPSRPGDRHARDIQFELTIWGMLRVGGTGARLAEPDVRFRLGSEELGVAAKRIWSLEQAKQRLSNGAAQIAESGLRGLIATNVQRYLEPSTALGELGEKGAAFGSDVSRLHGHLPYLMGKRHVVGLWLSGSAVAPGEGGGAVGPRRRDVSQFNQILCFADDADRAKFERFFTELGSALGEWLKTHL
jgi:hypothetical protein